MFDPLSAVVIVGATALAIALLCGGILIFQNLGSTTLTLAGSAVVGDLTDILDQRDRDYCIAKLRSRWGVAGK